MNKTVIATLLGGISGILAYLTHEYLVGEYQFFAFPGIVFGVFVAGFIWQLGFGHMRMLVWVFASWLSFLTAIWGTLITIGIFSIDNLVGIALAHGLAGLFGSSIFCLTLWLFHTRKIRSYFWQMVAAGTLIPFVLVFITGIEGGDFLGPSPTKEYYLLTMTLWQASILAIIVKTLRQQATSLSKA